MKKVGTLAFVLFTAVLAGCAATAPSTSAPSTSTSPPASVSEPAPAGRPAKRANLNLSGFPAPYQDGYVAGCEGRRRDDSRYKGDANYKMGWDDGSSICASRR